MWGIHWAGGIITAANPGYTVDELAFQLRDSKARAVVTQKPFLKHACAAARKAGIADNRVILMGDERDETGRFKHFTDIKCSRGISRYRKATIDPKKDLAFLVYSSGTTGYVAF
jgi:long-subunit acyl-CoA synthetase (AMP-forming)